MCRIFLINYLKIDLLKFTREDIHRLCMKKKIYLLSFQNENY